MAGMFRLRLAHRYGLNLAHRSCYHYQAPHKISFRQAKSVKNHFFLDIQRQQCTRIVAQSFASESQAATRTNDTAEKPPPLNRTFLIDQKLDILDNQARRFGRVDYENIKVLLQLVKKKGSITDIQALMLLRASGSLLVKERIDVRQALCEDIWKQLPSLGATYNTSHYNAFMQAQLDNGHPFVVADILAEMKEKNVKPNRLTYQLLIGRYCQDGDLEGARKILEHMKSEDLPLTEAVFNMLVKGHLNQGDTKGANAVMESMRTAGLDPTPETYRILLSGYAQKGDLGAMKKTCTDAQKDEVVLHPRHIFSAVLSLADAGHGHLTPQVLEMMPRNHRYNQDALNHMHCLLAKGHISEGILVYETMEKIENSTAHNLGGNILRSLVKHNAPLEQVREMQKKLESEGHSVGGLDTLAQHAVATDNIDYALELFKLMNEQSIQIQPHFFWPVFQFHSKAENPAGMFKALRVMLETVEDAKSALPTIYYNVAVKLHEMDESIDTIMDGLKEAGVKDSELTHVKALLLVREGRFSDVLASGNDAIQYIPTILNSEVPKGHKKSQETSSMIKFLESVKPVIKRMWTMNSQIFTRVINEQPMGKDATETFVDDWVTADLRLVPNFLPGIMKGLTRASISEAHVEKIKSLASGPTAPEEVADMQKMSISQLEEMMENQVKRSQPIGRVAIKLLLKYCNSGEVDKAEKLKTTLDERGFIFPRPLLLAMATMNCQHRERLADAIKYTKLMEIQYPEFKEYRGLVLRIAKLQVQDGSVDDAKQTLKGYIARHPKTEGETLDSNLSDRLRALCQALVDEAHNVTDATAVKELVDLFSDGGFINDDKSSVLIKSYLSKGAVDDAIAAFETAVTQHGEAPLFSDLYRELIRREDAERLQKVVDLVTTIQGELQVLQHLVLCFVEEGKPKQALKILETPGMRAVMPILIAGANRLDMLGKIDELTQLVNVTKNLFGVNRDDMLFTIVQARARRNDWKNVLDVYTMYEEEGIIPSGRTLRYIANVLTTHHQPIPFNIPVGRKKTPVTPEFKAANPDEELMLDAAKSERGFDSILDAHKVMKERGCPMRAELSQTVADILLNTNKVHFKKFVHWLAEESDVDALQLISKLRMANNLNSIVQQKTFTALIKRGRTEEILNHLEKNMALLNTYSSTPVLEEMVKAGQANEFSRMETLIHTYSETPDAVHYPCNHLFNFYVHTGGWQEAQDILQKYPRLTKRFSLRLVAARAAENKQETSLWKLVSICEDLSPAVKEVLYSKLLALKVEEQSWEGGLAVIDKAQSAGQRLEFMHKPTLQQFESLLLANNQTPPWPVGMFSKKDKTNPSVDTSQTSPEVKTEPEEDPEKLKA